MFQSYGTPITCPNCRNPFTVQLEQVLDVGRDPNAKARFLSGRVNVVNCPNCGYPSRLSAPIIYHDQSKEMLITYVPMELGLPKNESDRVTGALVNAVVNQIPTEQRKGYLLLPKTALTLQGMMETILEADGITKEMLEARREKVRVAEKMLAAEPDELPALINENIDRIDREFFELITASAESALNAGNRPAAEAMLRVRDYALQNTDAGRELLSQSAGLESIIQDVQRRVAALGANVTRAQVAQLVVDLAMEDQADPKSAETPQRLAVFLSMAAQILDQPFFDELDRLIDSADEADRLVIQSAEAFLLNGLNTLNAESELAMRSAADMLNVIANSEDIDAAIRSRLDSINELFIAVLQANIQAAEGQNDTEAAERLKRIYERIMALLAESTPPAVTFINDLLEMEPKAASMELAMRAVDFGPDLLQWFDLLMEQLGSSQNSQPLIQRLGQLRREAERALSNDSSSGDQGSGQGGNVLSFGQARRQMGNRSSEPSPSSQTPVSTPPADAPQSSQGNPNQTASGLVLPFTRKKKSE